MKTEAARENTHKKRLINFGGKNRKFYLATAIMLALILAPFGMYAALIRGNDLISGLFFIVIAGCMGLMLLIS